MRKALHTQSGRDPAQRGVNTSPDPPRPRPTEAHTVDSAVYACSGLVASSCKLVRRRNQPVPHVAAAFPGIPAAHEGIQGSLSDFILFYFQGGRPLRPDRQARTYREIKNAPPWGLHLPAQSVQMCIFYCTAPPLIPGGGCSGHRGQGDLSFDLRGGGC